MIVREEGEEFVIVRQADHAHLSGQLAAAWGAPPWSVPEPFPSVVVGARQHDDAWLVFDEAPGLTDEGRPQSFFEVDRVATSEMYRAGVDAVAVIDPYAGLLVSLHYSGFFHPHWDWQPFALPENFDEPQRSSLRTFVDGELARQRELRRALSLDGAEDAALAANYRWLQLWDRISLDICRQDAAVPWAVEYPEVPVSAAKGADRVSLKFAMVAAGRYTLNPYPLRPGSMRTRLPSARIRRKDYAGRAAFLDLWRTAPQAWIDIRLDPA